MGKKICIKCSTENEEHFSYCRYCGAALPIVDRQHHFYGDSGYSVQTDPKEIDFGAVSRSELEAYVGKNSEKLCRNSSIWSLRAKKPHFAYPFFFLVFLQDFSVCPAGFFTEKCIKSGQYS